MNVNRIHLELTNKCTLKCSRCSRTTFIDKFGIKNWSNLDIKLQDLQNFLDIDLKGIEFELCGNYGDPIYYDDLFDLIRWIKQQGACVLLTTNGSYKSQDWWKTLTDLLDNNDTITFSIDGTPENFTKYRINADWESIETGIKTVVQGSVKTIWKFIPFSFNEDCIEQTKKLSIELGIDNFEVFYSDRWEDNDSLKPSNPLLYGKNNISKINWKKSKDSITEIDPLCYKGTQHFISAAGLYTPCCPITDWRFYYNTKFYKDKDLYDISKTTISEVLDREQEFFQTILTEKPSYCTFNCPKT